MVNNDSIGSRKGIVLDDIRKGEVLFYYGKSEDADACTKVRVVGVHKDDWPNMYYTIVDLEEGGEERQTERRRLGRVELRAKPTSDIVKHETYFKRADEKVFVESCEGWFAEMVGKLGNASEEDLHRICVTLSLLMAPHNGSLVTLRGKGIGSYIFDLFKFFRRLVDEQRLGMLALLGGKFGLNWSYVLDDVGKFIGEVLSGLEDGEIDGVGGGGGGEGGLLSFLSSAALWAYPKGIVKVSRSLDEQLAAATEFEMCIALDAVKNLRRGVQKIRRGGGAIFDHDISVSELSRAVDLFSGDGGVTTAHSSKKRFFDSFTDFLFDERLHEDDKECLLAGSKRNIDKLVKLLWDDSVEVQVSAQKMYSCRTERGDCFFFSLTHCNATLLNFMIVNLALLRRRHTRCSSCSPKKQLPCRRRWMTMKWI